MATIAIALLRKIPHMRIGEWFGKCRPFLNDIALSKLAAFTNHPMRMCRILGFC
jgi:hypothetical protein